MPIKNYTTKIPAAQTVGEIQGILAAHGARQIMLDYQDNGHIGAIAFSIDTSAGRRGFQLPARAELVLKTLGKQRVKADYDQAERVAWRILKDWVDAQMAILESEQVEMAEIFLPYMLSDKGQTLYQVVRENPLMLGGAEHG